MIALAEIRTRRILEKRRTANSLKISGYVWTDKGLAQNRITKSSRMHHYIDCLRQEFCRLLAKEMVMLMTRKVLIS